MPFLSLSNFIFHPLAEYQLITLLSFCYISQLLSVTLSHFYHSKRSCYSVSGERVHGSLLPPIYSPLVDLGHVIVAISDD